jgi:hypothetical protein
MAEADALAARRQRKRATSEDTRRERTLRARIEALLDARGCDCACDEGWPSCECRYCNARLYNKSALARIGEYTPSHPITIEMDDVEALAGVLSQLIREGERGANFAIAEVRGTGVYLQFAGSPREPTMLWEAVAVDVVPSAAGVRLLDSLGLKAPGEGHSSPNYREEVALGDDPDATLLCMTLASFRILHEAYGCEFGAPIDVTVCMGAWED